MGGNMNLNPLKKDDNTDALVKALEDANSTAPTPTTAGQVAAVPSPAATDAPDASIIAADPQITGAGADNPLLNDSPADPVQNVAAVPAPPANDDLPTPVEEPADDTNVDAPAGIAFTGNDLPAGLSSDADAHLPAASTESTEPTEGSGDNSELDGVKKQALEQLRPLIEKLDLEPADKFEKYLMMLRASDDPALIKPAYEAAAAIEGEKEKAQALLDVINEINYITADKTS